ncbi:MAG: hypothetical protein ACYCUM_02825 [Solirubrobacteraceae bacterium]
MSRESTMTRRLSRTEHELEQAFAREISLERERRTSLLAHTEKRSRRRAHERRSRRGSIRFALLVATLIITAVLVTAVMFVSLYLLLQ